MSAQYFYFEGGCLLSARRLARTLALPNGIVAACFSMHALLQKPRGCEHLSQEARDSSGHIWPRRFARAAPR